MTLKSTLLLPFLLAAAPVSAQAPQTGPVTPPQAETDPAVIKKNSSYGFGYNHGNAFKQQISRYAVKLSDLEREQFLQGLNDALDEKEPSTSQEKLNAAMLGLQNIVQEREKALAAENLKKAEEFLAENGKREGVITTDSGLQYEVLTQGEGETYDDTQGAKFMVHYKGTLIDGSEFDASPEGAPVPMTLNVVPGFREALTTMPVGSQWKIFLKPELAYGEQRRGPQIEPNSALIFELELVEIQQPAPRPKAVSPPIQIPPAPAPTKEADKGETDSE
ncbi:FKBP-type peptidyl-prolyl cis-trans isomerase [Roseibacillus ishigakijimensis]|uniref:Peptidyl-prolyl cis-trans isomerase n=1 Tax=Roseibacillus ishigakijimensis TaxID=454146 RepID=A0A934VIZ5_9BACT|nr:FKBP-type peptidyl-prolyl cis-trans isomerase [Roseibacillus ishigakijimensis]MBK1835608.1 FKBP-type peptidyl-prolyl cis-trans isomerase [Roseibacillus ishigakijimensis]